MVLHLFAKLTVFRFGNRPLDLVRLTIQTFADVLPFAMQQCNTQPTAQQRIQEYAKSLLELYNLYVQAFHICSTVFETLSSLKSPIKAANGDASEKYGKEVFEFVWLLVLSGKGALAI